MERVAKEVVCHLELFPNNLQMVQVPGQRATHQTKSEMLIWYNFLFRTSILNINFDMFFFC